MSYTGRCLDVAGEARTAGAQLIQWSCHGAPNQQFEWMGSSLVARHSGLCLDVADGAQTNGARVIQAPCDGSRSQSLRQVGSQLVFAHSDLCLGILWPDDQGAHVIQQTCRGSDTQWWSLAVGERLPHSG